MYYLLYSIGYVVGSLSERAANRLADFLTWLAWDVLRKRRKLILNNITTAFGDSIADEEKARIGKSSVRSFILTVIEFFRSVRVNIGEKVKIEGTQHYHDAHAKGTGVWILCFHMGNWEAMASGISMQLAPARLVVKKVGSDSVDRFVTKLRHKNGMYPIVRKKKGDAVKKMFESVLAGDVVGFVMDQSRPGAPRVPFFGKSARTNTTFAAIWPRCKAPILPGYIVREKLGEHTVRFLPPIEMQESDDADKDILDNSQMFNHVVEDIVRKHPEHYFWFHNRWK